MCILFSKPFPRNHKHEIVSEFPNELLHIQDGYESKTEISRTGLRLKVKETKEEFLFLVIVHREARLENQS
jgi:hypothetical protein